MELSVVITIIMATCMIGLSLYTTGKLRVLYMVPAACWMAAAYLMVAGGRWWHVKGVSTKDFNYGVFNITLGITWIAIGVGYLFAF